MKCNNCGGNMTLMDVHKNDGKRLEDFEPETYVCDECDKVEFI